MNDYDVVVVGAGLAGAAAAWQLSARGHRTLVVEAYSLGHRRGSSHGTSRIYRRAYADPFYVALTGEAEIWWRRLETESGQHVRVRTGGLDTGDGRDLGAMAGLLDDHGVSNRLLEPDQIARRWPGMTTEGPSLFHSDAGYLDPFATMAGCLRLARDAGAVVRDETPVTALRPTTPDGVEVVIDGAVVTAGTAVIAVGAWLPELWPDLGLNRPAPQLTVKQQEVFHFRPASWAYSSAGAPGETTVTGWPTIVHKDGDPAPAQLYALASGADGGPEPAYKVAQFDSATYTTASARDFVVDPAARATVTDFVRRRLPGLDPEPVTEQSCLFTMTRDEDFVLDRCGPVVIASPCSGHGAKFAPLTGALIADLVEGAEPRRRFAL